MTISEKLTQVAENQQKIYDAGKQSEYDAFWDEFQSAKNGISAKYSGSYMFANAGWNDNTFKPKYSMMYLNNAGSMFQTCGVTDLSAALERQGVVFNFSGCANFTAAFAYAKLTRVPIINTLGTTAESPFNSMFNTSDKLHTIDKLILKSDGSQRFSSTFGNCTALENIVIEGAIGQNGLNLQWSTLLSHDSLMSIINALQDKSADTSGTSWIVTLGATNLAKLTDSEKSDARKKGWQLL